MADMGLSPKDQTEPCPPIVRELVERFERNREAYHAGTFNETQVRREFLDPFFAALGWDVDNKQGLAEAYKDVIHEDAIKIGGATKAPDYCFRIGGTRKFFVEAKKPAVGIKDNPEPAYQLRRYAWSAKLPLSILTDFEELAVYDCRIRPDSKDKSSKARILYLTCDEYAERWGELAAVFSKDAVLKGSFDKYAETARGKRGTAPVDDEFLKEIEGWRDAMARNFALRNENLSVRDLNFAVGRTIDRIIFLRMCEDRGIEPYGRLQGLVNGTSIYGRLAQLFREADDKYNAGLFYFRQEADRGPPDALTLGLALDDKVLKDILGKLYYPESPYEFGVLSADILGQVYEQFLGKVIRLTAGHRAVVEEKPEVRKAGGVYYTPTYIVDYIVKHTVGKLLEDKSPTDIGPERETKTGKPRKLAKGAKMLRVLDPACGSGSFLLGAYQYLLDWHRDWYVSRMGGAEQSPDRKGGVKSEKRGTRDAQDSAPLSGERRPLPRGRGSDQKRDAELYRDRIYQSGGGQWRLTIREKKRILLNNIYGVDIDPQAVEVTKLSLLLKVLEGETAETVGSTLRLFHERALPDLSNNIKCGNSLIGPDFYEGRQLDMFDEEERYRINAFDWQREFPEAFDAGGFDAVIGNPPYIRIQNLRESAPEEASFYKARYSAAGKGSFDIYVLFVQRGLALLNAYGHVGFILPHKFFNAEYGAPLRARLGAGRHVRRIVHFGHQQIFTGGTTYTCLLLLSNKPAAEIEFVAVDDLQHWRFRSEGAAQGLVALPDDPTAVWNFVVGEQSTVFRRLAAIPTTLADVANVFVGLQTSADDVFTLDLVARDESVTRVRSRLTGDELELESVVLHRLISGTDVNRYMPLPDRQVILFPYRVTDESATLIPFREFEASYPKAAAYLLIHRRRLENRERGKFKDARWYRFGRSQNLGIQSRIKLCVPRLVEQLGLSFDARGECFMDNVDVCGVTLKPARADWDIRCLLALLNSRLLRWYFPFVSAPFRGGWLSANRQFLSKLPLVEIHDTATIAELARRTQTMLDLHKRLPAAKTVHDKTVLQRDIDATDREIDRLVYELYGLSEEEIGIVEEGTK